MDDMIAGPAWLAAADGYALYREQAEGCWPRRKR